MRHQQYGAADRVCMNSVPGFVHESGTPGSTAPEEGVFCGEKHTLEKLVSVTTDGAPVMTSRHAGFAAQCKGDPDFPKFLHYHCIIHQQAICAKALVFDHVMTQHPLQSQASQIMQGSIGGAVS